MDMSCTKTRFKAERAKGGLSARSHAVLSRHLPSHLGPNFCKTSLVLLPAGVLIRSTRGLHARDGA